MKSFFKKNGPFDINFLLSKTIYSKKKKFKKEKINDVSSLLSAKKNDITFFNNINYIEILNNTKASYCFIENKFIKQVNNKNLNLIISANPLLDFILISKIFYPEADKDCGDFQQNNKYLKLKNKNNTLIDKNAKVGKNFSIGLNSVIKKNVCCWYSVWYDSKCSIFVLSSSFKKKNTLVYSIST